VGIEEIGIPKLESKGEEEKAKGKGKMK